MPIVRQERESPLLWDWEFEDELGVFIRCGRFIVPNKDTTNMIPRMAEFVLNDGRSGVARTEKFRSAERIIYMTAVPYNIMREFQNRIGVKFRIMDCFGDYMWCVLRDMQYEPIPGRAFSKTEQLYDMNLTFVKTNPI